METVLRWGRSAYETDLDLGREQRDAEALGLSWKAHEDRSRPDSLAQTDVLVVNSGVRVDEAVLDALRGNLVITTTSGWDHIDAKAARKRGIAVCRCPEARRDAVVETTVAGLMGVLRAIPHLHAAATRGTWARGDLPSLGPGLLAEATVAVVGASGVIGRPVCATLQALGARVIGVDPAGVPEGVEAAPLGLALNAADAVTLHCHLNDRTRGLIGPAQLDALGPDGVVINTARGPILDVAEVVSRLEQGRLRGALVDVFPEEPYPALADGAAVPGVWFLPHAAGFTSDLGTRVARGVHGALQAHHLGGPLPHRVA